MDHDLVQVTTTVPDEATAHAIAAMLVDAHLAACVQVDGPIRSRYRWEDAIEVADEWRCVAMSTSPLAAAVVDAVVDAHPDDVPEVVVTPVVRAHRPYAAWVASAVTPTG